jgi:hypothetical protein
MATALNFSGWRNWMNWPVFCAINSAFSGCCGAVYLPCIEFPSLPQPLSWYLGARARLLDGVLLSWTQQQPDCEFIAAPANGYAPLMASDGFHPGPKVYELWAAEIARRLTDPA